MMSINDHLVCMWSRGVSVQSANGALEITLWLVSLANEPRKLTMVCALDVIQSELHGKLSRFSDAESGL